MESKRAVPTFNSVAAEIGELVTEKNQCYGDSFAKCGEFLRLLYPTGLEPSKYGDALSMVRIFDKQMRIATRKDAFGESPYKDICGYGLLGATADAKAAMFHTPLSPEQVAEITTDYFPPSLCATCIRDVCELLENRAKSLANGECVFYLPREGDGEGVEVDEWAERDLCRRCDYAPCGDSGKKGKTARCDTYASRTKQEHLACSPISVAKKQIAMETAAEKSSSLSLSLPSITVEGDLEDVHEKYEEERQEWGMCDAGTLESDIEAWDIVQVRQTYAERGGNVDVLTGGRPEYVLRVIAERYADAPEQVLAAKRAMIVKNAARAMYAPEVCLKIVMSGGKDW